MKSKRLYVLAISALMTLASCGGGNSNSSDGGNSGSANQSEAASIEESSQKGGAVSISMDDLPVFDDSKVTEPSIVIHYYRFDNDYSDSSIWLWRKSFDGAQYMFEYIDGIHNEHIAVIPISGIAGATGLNEEYGIIFRAVAGWSWQTSDIMVDFSTYDTKNGNAKHVYFVNVDEVARKEGLYEIDDAISNAYFRTEKRIQVDTSNAIDRVYLYKDGNKITEKIPDEPTKSILIDLPKDGSGAQTVIDYFASYEVEVHFAASDASLKAVPSFYRLYGTSEFNAIFAYDGDDLGAVYSSDKTSFKVWSPFSEKIELRIYSNGTPTSVDPALGDDSYQNYEMAKGEKGVWEKEVDGDLNGKYYTYVVTSKEYPKGQEVVDPYAKSCGVNGLRGMVLDFSETNPNGWDTVEPIEYDRKELAVYETHLVDPTMSSTWTDVPAYRKLEGTYKGFIQEGTTYTKGDKTIPTGFDHIKRLAPNAVQIQPIFDQANDEINKSFNWGYNPLNYNCLEGAYSSNPYDGAIRVKEFKEVVKALNQEGMNVIMDVVYNHVNSVNGLSFDVLCPHYYFRYTDNVLSNGSGCGNETASENFMFAKFMKDSALFWATEYKLGGFRFDLMALHNYELMNELTAEVKDATFDDFCIYGEPWTGGSSPLAEVDRASQANLSKFEGYGAFNDMMRDSLIKSGMNATSATGWASVSGSAKAAKADTYGVANGIKGHTCNSSNSSFNRDPNKAVQYASCHDNYTLFDRLTMAYSNDGGKTTTASEDLLHYGPMLANGMVLSSNGTSFILSGEEFLRTKTKEDGTKDGNSYESSYEENALDYDLAIDNDDVVEFYSGMIAFKRNVDDLHLEMEEADELEVNVSSTRSMISYRLQTKGKEFFVAARNGTELSNDDLSDVTVDFSGYNLYLDSRDVKIFDPSEPETMGSKTLSPFEFVIGYKNL